MNLGQRRAMARGCVHPPCDGLRLGGFASSYLEIHTSQRPKPR
jgi:hypothetical protein